MKKLLLIINIEILGNFIKETNINYNSKESEKDINVNNIEQQNNNILNDEYVYIGCEDGNIKLIKINNESIIKRLLNKC